MPSKDFPADDQIEEDKVWEVSQLALERIAEMLAALPNELQLPALMVIGGACSATVIGEVASLGGEIQVMCNLYQAIFNLKIPSNLGIKGCLNIIKVEKRAS